MYGNKKKKYNKNKLNNLYINYYDGGGEVVAAPSLSHISGADISTPSVSGPSAPGALNIDPGALKPQIETKTPFLKNALKSAGPMSLVNKGVDLVSGTLSSAIGGGLQSGAGNTINKVGGFASDILGKVNPILGAAGKLATGLFSGFANRAFGSKLNKEKINQISSESRGIYNTVADRSSADSLMNQMSTAFGGSRFSKSDIGKDGWFSNKAAKEYKRLKREQEVAQARQIRTFADASKFLDTQNDLNMIANYAAFGGPLDYMNIGGGAIGYDLAQENLKNKRLQTLNQGKLTALPNSFQGEALKTFDEGGPLLTHGSIWSNGVTYINNGGTHEENPYEGVLMGIDNQGTPNLVEEGEVVFNDYVFSNRLTVPNQLRKKYKLGDKLDVTFADAVKKLSKESEERPNDPISKNGLNVIMNEFSQAQEGIRMEEQAKKAKKEFNKLSPEEQLGIMQAAQQQQQYAYGGIMGNIFSGKGDRPNAFNTYGYVSGYNNNWFNENGKYTQDYLDRVNALTIADINKFAQSQYDFYTNASNADKATDRYKAIQAFYNTNPQYNKSNYDYTNELDVIKGLATDHKPGYWHMVVDQATRPTPIQPADPLSIKEPAPIKIATQPQVQEVDKEKNGWLEYARYAPAIISGGMVLKDLFTDPDYTNAESIEDASDAAGQWTAVRAGTLGNFLAPKIWDRNWYSNKLSAESAATRNAILNNSSLSRNAALLAADQNALTKLGDMFRIGEEFNTNEEFKRAQYNTDIEKYNSDVQLRAALANQAAEQQAKNSRLNGIMHAAQMREDIDARLGASKSANLTAFADNLGSLGEDYMNRKDRDFYIKHVMGANLPLSELRRLYGTSYAKEEAKRRGYSDIEINKMFKAAKGGKLNRKRGGFTY